MAPVQVGTSSPSNVRLLNLPIGLLTNWASNRPEQLPAPVRFVADEPWVPLAVVTALSIDFLWGDAPEPAARPFVEACGELGLLRHRGRKRVNYQFLHPRIQRYLAEGDLGSRRSSADREDEAAV